MMRPLRGNPAGKVRPMGPLIACLVLMITAAQAAALIDDHMHSSQHQQHPAAGQTRAKRTSRSPAPASTRTRAWQSAWTVRGGYQHHGRSSDSSSSNRGYDTHKNDENDHVPPRGATTDDSSMEKIAADLRAKKDHIATHIHARGEAIAADLKAKQEKIADEVLRERSPEAFGELSGHASSYDSATAGMDVANRRSFFLGIRRIVLLVQVVELLAACIWQTASPFGGVAGFVTGAAGGTSSDAPKAAKSSLRDIMAGGVAAGDGRGRLGLAVAASLAQFSVYTMLLVWFGCDRVVLRAVRVTGWEHGAAAAWALTRLVTGPGGKLMHLAVCAWLAGMAFLCGYFGRQL